MAVRNLRPTSPGVRGMSVQVDKTLAKKGPEKSLTEGIASRGGRNNRGRMTVRHQGGGAKRLYRKVDFKRKKDGIPATVLSIEYDPNRSARIALIRYQDGEKSYILAPVGLKPGDVVASGTGSDIRVGNTLPMRSIPLGTMVHAVELHPGRGAQMARSAGAVVQIMAKEGDFALLRLPSGEQRRVPLDCRATIGQIGNLEHENISLGKAGRSRWMGKRPSVRGVAMNPVDHPHGGGEGKAPIGRAAPVSPWGLPMGKKTRKKNQSSDQYIVKRRKK